MCSDHPATSVDGVADVSPWFHEMYVVMVKEMWMKEIKRKSLYTCAWETKWFPKQEAPQTSPVFGINLISSWWFSLKAYPRQETEIWGKVLLCYNFRKSKWNTKCETVSRFCTCYLREKIKKFCHKRTSLAHCYLPTCELDIPAIPFWATSRAEFQEVSVMVE